MKRAAALGAALLLLCGCAAGPRYHAPETTAPPAFKEEAAAALRPAEPRDAMMRGTW